MEGRIINCPSCGASLNEDSRKCSYCGNDVYISRDSIMNKMNFIDLTKKINSYNKVLNDNPQNYEANFSMGICKLQQKLYDEAIELFERNVNYNLGDSESFFYLAVATLRGKKPFLLFRKEIDKIENYLNNAIALKPKGIYYYFLGYVRYDHHERKGYLMKDKSEDYFELSLKSGIKATDIINLHEILGNKIPEVIADYYNIMLG